MPLGVSTVTGNVIVLPAEVKVCVPLPEKVCSEVPDTVTPEPRMYEP